MAMRDKRFSHVARQSFSDGNVQPARRSTFSRVVTAHLAQEAPEEVIVGVVPQARLDLSGLIVEARFG